MISVRTCKTEEVLNYKNRKYNEFKDYFFNTNIPVNEIYKKINVNKTNSTGRFIRDLMRKNGLNSDIRWNKIKKGEWLK